MARSQFPRARPTKAAAKKASLPRLTKGWQRRTHVLTTVGHTTLDGRQICDRCGYPEDHAIHDLTQSIEVSELDSRKLGERE